MHRKLSLGRVLLIFALGIATGAQGALYLYDTFDDGVSDPISGVIALAFALIGALLVWRSFRPGRSGD